MSSAMQSHDVHLWTGTWGPVPDDHGCLFRIWARPDARMELVLEGAHGAPQRTFLMTRQPNGIFEHYVEGAGPGTRYWFRIDGNGPFPDPASRYQPEGVHKPSQVVGVSDFSWSGDDFVLPPLGELVIYELHIGTFTPAGTFVGAIEKLPSLKALGVTAIELMPIADFAGERNWGYDGVSLYAPAHTYGTPDDLRLLVREAHRQGLAVLLDVVYNHLGPDGAYHSTFSPQFYSGRHHTPWGDGLNFDGEGCQHVRNYFIESAVMWVRDYHIDGLRCDATDTIQDDSKLHFLTELTERVHGAGRDMGRKVLLIAEDARNERLVITPPEKGGHGFDALWSDDFHHHMRHRMAGDNDGYYRDFSGSAADIAATIQNGWCFTGQISQHWGRKRGTSFQGLSHESRVFCIQNHDQIGNRAMGDRLNAEVNRPALYAASALLLLAPEVPLIFMGQEWAAPEPFLFFTDHHDELGRLVTEGRRKEFEHFAAFADESKRESIPDPQAPQTFERSKLDWQKREQPEHAGCLRWYTALLHLRHYLVEHAHFRSSRAWGQQGIATEWKSGSGPLITVVCIEGAATVRQEEWQGLEPLLSSEQSEYIPDPQGVQFDAGSGAVVFQRPGVLLLGDKDWKAQIERITNETRQ